MDSSRLFGILCTLAITFSTFASFFTCYVQPNCNVYHETNDTGSVQSAGYPYYSKIEHAIAVASSVVVSIFFVLSLWSFIAVTTTDTSVDASYNEINNIVKREFHRYFKRDSLLSILDVDKNSSFDDNLILKSKTTSVTASPYYLYRGRFIDDLVIKASLLFLRRHIYAPLSLKKHADKVTNERYPLLHQISISVMNRINWLPDDEYRPANNKENRLVFKNNCSFLSNDENIRQHPLTGQKFVFPPVRQGVNILGLKVCERCSSCSFPLDNIPASLALEFIDETSCAPNDLDTARSVLASLAPIHSSLPLSSVGSDVCNPVYKMPGVHHCRTCGKCIVGMDHHCPWIGCCVGRHNLKHFFLYILYTGLASLFVFLATTKDVFVGPSSFFAHAFDIDSKGIAKPNGCTFLILFPWAVSLLISLTLLPFAYTISKDIINSTSTFDRLFNKDKEKIETENLKLEKIVFDKDFEEAQESARRYGTNITKFSHSFGFPYQQPLGYLSWLLPVPVRFDLVRETIVIRDELVRKTILSLAGQFNSASSA